MKKFLLFMFAAFTFAACEQAPIEEQSAIRHEVPETITVGFEGDDTRIQLNEAQKTVWTKDDLVSVFYRSNANQQWKYDGETGARTAELKRVDAGTATRDIDRVVVVYPYDENYYINPETYNVQASLPAVQNYLQNSYSTNGNIMISSSEYNQFSLKSVCGWLKLQIMGDGEKIKSIKLRGNNGEQVAGELYINSADATAALAADMGSADDNNAGGSLVFDDTILEEVTLDCGEGVALGKSATMFYIALPPQTFAKGLTVEISATNGLVMTKSTDNSIVIERNHIQPMTTFGYNGIFTNNEIYYTNGSTTAPTAPNDPAAFGNATIQSNTYDAEKECWVITFDKDVTEIGDWAFFNCDSLTSVTIPDSVTTIGYEAFRNCYSLTSVTIPDSVTTIGRSAFDCCTSLTSVTIGNSVTTIEYQAFRYCTSLTSVTIPDSVTTIGYFAFAYCTSLTSVTIPDSVTTIGVAAFDSCTSLTSVTIGDSVTTIGGGAFCECDSLKEFKGKFAADGGRCLIMDNTIIAYANASGTTYTIPDSVTTIGGDAFGGCESLTSVTIGDSVTTIGDWAFWGCGSLTSVTIGDSVTTIGDAAFRNCNSLTSVTIPDSITSIGDYAFLDCDSLTSVTIGDSVTSIGSNAFRNCDSLKKVYCYATIPPSLGIGVFYGNASGQRIYVYEECVESYKSDWDSYKDSIYTNGKNCPSTTTIEYTTNDGNTITSSKLPIISNNYENGIGTLIVAGKKITHIPASAFNDCDSLTSITIPDSVTSIGYEAFLNCDSLTSITIPDSVTTIGGSAFQDCISLTSITIPDSVTEIGSSAFCNCYSLTSVTIPDSVTTIGDYAFYYCNSLTSITIPDSVTSIGYSAFEDCYSLTEFKGKFADGDGRILVVDGELIAFAQAGITEYTIPDSVTEIGSYAFRNCDSLTSITIPNSVTTIGYEAFYNCDSLTSITIPDSVTTIEYAAFRNCNSLTSVTIPDSVTSIGSCAFQDCNSLTEFKGKFADGDGRILVVDGKLIAFAQAGITEYTIPDSVTSIGYEAFCSCDNLTSVTIGDSVTTIEYNAFQFCYSLTSVYCKATTPPTLNGTSAFNVNGSGRKIYVPAASLEAYKGATNWSRYASAIVGYDFENGVVVE